MTQPVYPARQLKLACYGVAFACGPLGAWLTLRLGLGLHGATCAAGALLTLLVIAPVVEEIVFRRGLQNWLAARFSAHIGGLSLANGLVALTFGSLHALHQGSAWMLLTAAPALVLGWMFELSGRRLTVPVLLHAWYNLCITLASCP
jgi:membrane protease YdiL (CAAX protease family)